MQIRFYYSDALNTVCLFFVPISISFPDLLCYPPESYLSPDISNTELRSFLWEHSSTYSPVWLLPPSVSSNYILCLGHTWDGKLQNSVIGHKFVFVFYCCLTKSNTFRRLTQHTVFNRAVSVGQESEPDLTRSSAEWLARRQSRSEMAWLGRDCSQEKVSTWNLLARQSIM